MNQCNPSHLLALIPYSLVHRSAPSWIGRWQRPHRFWREIKVGSFRDVGTEEPISTYLWRDVKRAILSGRVERRFTRNAASSLNGPKFFVLLGRNFRSYYSKILTWRYTYLEVTLSSIVSISTITIKGVQKDDSWKKWVKM